MKIESHREILASDAVHRVLSIFRDFRWGRKCKKSIKRVRSQLELQKNRRKTIIRQTEADIAQLHNSGHQKIALARVKQLHKDQCLLHAYQQIEEFCDCISLSIFTRHSKMTVEVNEAISSLVFAASRCGELSELSRIRILFQKRFGRDLERVNVELLPGNCVNVDLIYHLGNKSLLEEEKLHLIYKIATEFNKNIVSERTGGQENKDDLLKADSRETTNTELQSQDSKIKNMLNRIGTNFPSTHSTHLGTIHCDYYDDNSQIKQDLVREEEESTKPQLSHVHPKLPDYDNVVDTFTRYKKDRLMKSDSKIIRALGKWLRW